MTKSVEGVASSAKSNNGLAKSSRLINGVDEIRVCRRSPRFLAMETTPEISDKKNLGMGGIGSCRRSPRFFVMEDTPEVVKAKACEKMSSGSKMLVRKIDGFEGCRRSPRLMARENTPGGKLKIGLDCSSKKIDGMRSGGRSSSSRSSRFVSVIARTPELCEMKSGLDMGNGQLICGGSVDKIGSLGVRSRGSTKRRRKVVPVMSSMESVTPKGKQKKKINVECGNNENLGMRDDQLIETANLSYLRTPLCSIENISPTEKQTLGGGKNLKKLVVSQKALKGSVKSMVGLKKAGASPIGNQCGVRGWTKEQELALQRAYFAAKPSPHIWKRISKMVPGKSAQDCFDKIQSKSITPLSQPRRRSRTAKTRSPSSSPLSGSKLLESDTKLKVKKPRGAKGTKRVAQKTVRHLLQKQNLANQGYKKDLFSILEPNVSASIASFQVVPEGTALVTPKCAPGRKDFLANFNQRSLSHKSPLSRCSDSSYASRLAPSPAVLKQVKDMSVHEKYIDQLHSREAKRKAGSKRNGKEEKKEGVQVDLIKAAKNALVSDASDMIKSFQHMQANALDSCDGLYDVDEDSAEEDEDC